MSSKPGVIKTIVQSLRSASESKPVTKAKIVSEVHLRYPDRNQASIKSTVNQQVPYKLRLAGFDVKKNSVGYWLESNAQSVASSGNAPPTDPGANGGIPLSSLPTMLPPPEPTPPQTIRIDHEVYQALQRCAIPFVETPNDVIRRLLRLKPRNSSGS